MKRNNGDKECNSEPMYDDVTLEMIEIQETEILFKALIEYCVDLEKQVVDLRRHVNRLIPAGKPLPYEDLHSDIYQKFYDYAAYPKFEHLFKPHDM